MDKNPFEKIGGYASIDISDMLKTLQEKSEFKKTENQTMKLNSWRRYAGLIVIITL